MSHTAALTVINNILMVCFRLTSLTLIIPMLGDDRSMAIRNLVIYDNGKYPMIGDDMNNWQSLL